MILVKLNGGMGNQLFQYAMARRVSIKAGLPLYLDTQKFESCTLRKFALKHFNIDALFAKPEDKWRLHIHRKIDPIAFVHGLLDLKRPLHKRRIIRELSFRFEPSLLQIKTPAYLEGDWQSPKYFEDVEETIREDFTLKALPYGKTLETSHIIRNAPDSISIHIRRGDLVSDPNTNQTHGTLPMEYYTEALASLAPKLEEPTAFLFSDDPNWAIANFPAKGITLHPVDHNNEETAHFDLLLMSQCQHHIIANSTFSWWAAWLCGHPEKTVHYPKNWFKDSPHDTTDLFPADWIRVG